MSIPDRRRPWSRYMLRKLPQQAYFARLLAARASSAILAVGLCGCQTSATSDITGSLGDKAETSRRRRPSARPGISPRALSGQPQGCRRGAAIRQGAPRHGAAGPGGCGARAGHASPTRQQGAAGRLWAGAGGQRQFPAGLRRARPRPQPRRSRLAHPLGARSRTRSARPVRGSAAVLRERAEDRARRTVRAVQSRAFLRLSKDLPKAEETLRRAYGRAGADQRVRPNLALVVGLQGRLAEAESIVKADLPPEEAAANVAVSEATVGRERATPAQRRTEKCRSRPPGALIDRRRTGEGARASEARTLPTCVGQRAISR